MKLRDYQLAIADKAVALLRLYRIAYLGMEVRTGKSLTALKAAWTYGSTKVLFVTKKKAISSIEGDYATIKPPFTLLVTNYENLHNIKGSFDLIICDEAHSLGQYPIASERTRLLKKVCVGLPIIYLSGTPSPESYSQLYHQFWISSFSPFEEKSFYKWANTYVDKKVRFIYNKQINDYSHAKKDLIDAKSKHLFLSYSQSEAGFTQSVQEEVLYVDMLPGTYALAKKIIKDRVYIGTGGQEIVADTEVSLQQKTHQIFSGTVISTAGEGIVFDSTKGVFIREYFKGKKIVIFYKYQAEAQIIENCFGNLTKDPQEFNQRNEATFYSQVQSGREGVNLATADALVFFNIDFSAVSYWQARARMQVKERTKPALLYWIFARGGIEDKIYKVVQGKKAYTVSYFKKDYLK